MLEKKLIYHCMTVLVLASLFPGSMPSFAHACDNPWGSRAGNTKMLTGLPKLEDVRLCLPAGFAGQVKEGGVSFSDPSDSAGVRGSLGLAISPGSNFSASDSEMEYQRLKGWLCQLANLSAGTLCTITRLKDNYFVLLKGLGINVYSEVYVHTGNGYMLALTAEAPSDAALSALRPVIQDADIP